MSFISIEIVYKNMFYKKVIKKSFWLKCISFISIETVYKMMLKNYGL